MDADTLGGLAIVAFWIPCLVGAVRDKPSRDANDCIRRFSRAWWVILFFTPFGWIWCLVRAFRRPALEPALRRKPNETR